MVLGRSLLIYATIFVLLTETAQAQPHQSRELALNNFQHEITTCVAYFSIVQQCIANRGDDESKQLANVYGSTKDELVQVSVTVGQLIGMTKDAMVSRLKIEGDQLMTLMNHSCVNISSIAVRHGNSCKNIAENYHVLMEKIMKR